MNWLKNAFSRVFCGLALLGAVVLAPVDLPAATDTRFFAVGNNAFGATNAYAIIPAVGDRVAVVRSLNVSTDSGVGRMTLYSNGCCAVLQQDSGAGNTNFHVASGTGYGGTNGFAIGDNVIIKIGNTPTDTYTRGRVAAVGTTNITVFPATAPSATAVAGSMLYRMGTNAVFVGITNGATSFNGSGVVAVSARGEPLLIDIWGGSSCFINCAAGEFIAEK